VIPRSPRAGAALLAIFGVLLLVGDASPGLAQSAKKKKRRAKPTATRTPDFRVDLPVLGTKLEEFPPGPGKATADQACLQCHSASMSSQQRLNDKQWLREIDKMAGWGAPVPADKKDELLAYLVAHFGPDNRFEPVVTRPVGK